MKTLAATKINKKPTFHSQMLINVICEGEKIQYKRETRIS
jgi:hypothetical protein